MTPGMDIALHLSDCPDCGYSLSGLPRDHRCPECGFAYDESMFVLHGWALPPLRCWRPKPLSLAVGFLVLLVLLVSWLQWSLWTLLVALIASTMIAILLVVYAHTEGGTEERAFVQYLFSRAGIRRAGGTLHKWHEYSHTTLVTGALGYRVHVYPRWWRLRGRLGVNVQVDSDVSRAEYVRQVIEQRMSDAWQSRRAGNPVRAT